jgi:hypothetical protein
MKRSVLSICFLLALSLSSLCLLSSKISLVYASSEQIINGDFEYGNFTGWADHGDTWQMISSDDPHSGSYCAINGSLGLDLNQMLVTPIIIENISSFTVWIKCAVSDGIMLEFFVNDTDYEYYFSDLSPTWTQYDLKLILLSLNITISEQFEGIEFNNYGDELNIALDDLTLSDLPFPVSLDIQGDPELNYDFLMNGSAYTTPYSNSNFTSGNITLENNSPSLTVGHFIYTFSYWSINATDNLTSSSFTVDIEGNTTISLVFSKAIMDIVFDPRNIASEIVHLADTGSQLGRMLGVNSFIGGLIMSAIICAIFLFPVMIFKRTLLPMAIMGFLGLAISTGLGFLPFWIDLVLLLIISILFSGKIRDAITGAGH